jgi:hypothetical protein
MLALLTAAIGNIQTCEVNMTVASLLFGLDGLFFEYVLPDTISGACIKCDYYYFHFTCVQICHVITSCRK